MGFLKAFELAKLDQLTQSISKPVGVVWLLTLLLFLLAAIFFLFQMENWWIPAAVAVVLSQLVIILSWQDAKFGTIMNVIILLVVIVGMATWKFTSETAKELENLLAENETSTALITEEMLHDLPSNVRTWLNHVGVVGREDIDTISFRQIGEMKLEPDGKWSASEAEQYVTTGTPGFWWRVSVDMLPVVDVVGRDLFRGGTGDMKIKVASLFPVVNVSNNEKVDQSTMQRFLLELPLFPTAALQPYISWKEVDPFTAEAQMRYEGMEAIASFHFDKNGSGELVRVSAFRYKDHDEKAEPIECIGQIHEYEEINGLRIPVKVDISWVLEGEPFTWYRFEVVDFRLQ
ncbi:hypothetical protein KS419_05535 [Bacillus tamaricis]|uniref:Uncharacterized protein n=2 Tax=Evansella tamaricis TaxID=2069301 RepID=A0ABS6JC90_9BACI|nr:DUF6544 family protein [Evansella tamaricis]MBU9711191.1 hypothetical protein [Evansella tamaricis]